MISRSQADPLLAVMDRLDTARPAPDGRRSLGRAAEDAAAAFLRRAGYEIVARNVTIAGAEIDLVVSDGEVLCFVEVRSRSNGRHGSPLETIRRVKQGRIARAASAFLARRGLSLQPARFDVVGVEWERGRPRVTHVRGAFESPR